MIRGTGKHWHDLTAESELPENVCWRIWIDSVANLNSFTPISCFQQAYTRIKGA